MKPEGNWNNNKISKCYINLDYNNIAFFSFFKKGSFPYKEKKIQN